MNKIKKYGLIGVVAVVVLIIVTYLILAITK